MYRLSENTISEVLRCIQEAILENKTDSLEMLKETKFVGDTKRYLHVSDEKGALVLNPIVLLHIGDLVELCPRTKIPFKDYVRSIVLELSTDKTSYVLNEEYVKSYNETLTGLIQKAEETKKSFEEKINQSEQSSPKN